MLAEEKIVVFWGARGGKYILYEMEQAFGFGKIGLWPRGKWGKMVDEIGL